MTLESRKKWIVPEKISNASSIVDDILLKRGILDHSQSFLNPSLNDIPSWEKLHGTKKAAEEILEAIKNGDRIFIHGDFDVDGICATAILWEFLYFELAKHLNVKVDVLPYIPDRIDEGYGLSKSSVDSMLGNAAKLIITVDCGVRDRKLIEEYMDDSSCKFIITDHHQPPEDIKTVKYTLVHQMFPGKEYPEQKVCGAFVSFMLTNAIRELIGMQSSITIQSPGLDLVALATVTDMMPLIGVNRAVVKYGIEQMKKGGRVGMNSLLDISGVDPSSLDSYHLGFVIGPRINAAGRIGSAMEALKLLVNRDARKASALASGLQNLNALRQEKTSEVLSHADSLVVVEDPVIFVYSDGWHEGVIGLVAGKLLEKYGKPVVLATQTEEGAWKGSARSVETFNITNAIASASDHLERYGGHAQAAGFTVKSDQIEQFKEKLLKFAHDNIGVDVIERTLDLDAQIEPLSVDSHLFEAIETLKPFGYGNSKPLMYIADAEIIDIMLMKQGEHMKLKINNGGKGTTALMFNCKDDSEQFKVGDRVDLAAYISLNEWNGYRNIELQVKEWRRPDLHQ
ncbi:MAG TPA: single-stranded-DNA-specific exonuclease RecJ [Candidatus Dojkabacteria bacterium]|nr:single-stranded-DNA-specific exonuclease RecJ [Candidatus Dojkabacteria bacterium]